jgi:magnesium transporter
VILGKRFIITYRQTQSDLVDYLKKDFESNFKLAGRTPGFIEFLLFQHCLYNYSRINLMNDNFLDELELCVMSGDISKDMQRISTAGYNILTLKKLNSNLHIILLMLVSKQSYTISEEARISLSEMLTETISIRDAIDSSRYLLDSIIASIDADASRKTSEIIRVLTITSVIFMPLTLITGIFGMNFHNLPGLESENGFLYSMLAMGFIIIGFLGILWHLGWLRPMQRKK